MTEDQAQKIVTKVVSDVNHSRMNSVDARASSYRSDTLPVEMRNNIGKSVIPSEDEGDGFIDLGKFGQGYSDKPEHLVDLSNKALELP